MLASLTSSSANTNPPAKKKDSKKNSTIYKSQISWVYHLERTHGATQLPSSSGGGHHFARLEGGLQTLPEVQVHTFWKIMAVDVENHPKKMLEKNGGVFWEF